MLTMGQCDREDTEGKENEKEKKSTISLQSLFVLLQQFQINHANTLQLKDNIKLKREKLTL